MTDMVVVPIGDARKVKQQKKKKPRMLTPKDDLTVNRIPIGDLMRSKRFTTFDAMRQEANRIVGKMRNNWMDYVLMKAGIYINYAEITRREVIEIYEKNQISITQVDNVDRIYKADVLIGEWDRERIVYLDETGRLMLEIRYFSF